MITNPGPASTASATEVTSPRRPWRTFRHPLPIRIMHWVNAAVILIMLGSGFQIFNAHPALYWGERSDPDRALFEMKAIKTEVGQLRGVTIVLGRAFETTGILGASRNSAGELKARGFPLWVILPSGQWLAMGRRWHFFFAWLFVLNGVVFAVYSVMTKHFSKDLMPRWREFLVSGRALIRRVMGQTLERPTIEKYSPVQKLFYFGVVFVCGPLVVFTGLAMSPWLDAAFPWLPSFFGGHQSARTIHFLTASAMAVFTAIHLFMVVATGFARNLHSMISGWYYVSKVNRYYGKD